MVALMKAKYRLVNLVKKAKDSDRAAFQETVACCRSDLESVIRHQLGELLKRHVEIDDIVQETFLRAFRSIGEFEWRGDESFFRWLTSISRHVVLEFADRQKRDKVVPLREDIQNQDPTLSRAFRRKERFDRLQVALDKLNPDQREVVLLARVEKIPIKEIAKRMKRSPNAVSHLLLRALQQLRNDFGDTESYGLPDLPLRGEGIDSDG